MLEKLLEFVVAGVFFYIIFGLYFDFGRTRRCKERDAMYHTFMFPKQNDVGNRFLGDRITSFLEDYHMGSDYFTSTVMSPAVLDAMDEYRRQHPADDETAPD